MLSAIISTAFAAAALAAPVVERQAAKGGPSDAVILNYALTLEHLEDQFYKAGLAMFSEEDFAAYGLDNVFYTNLKTISSDEATHVSFLTGALTAAGATPVVANTYDFGFSDIKGFLTVANVLEGVGISAYLGAAQYIADATYLTAAGSILTVEARHSAFLRADQTPQESPFPAAFDIPLDFNEVVTLAAPFITALNPANPPLPVKGFPAITATPAAGAAGDKIALVTASDVDAKFAYFITITGSVAAPLTGSGKDYTIEVPAGAPAGQSYVVLTSSNVTGTPSDSVIVAGPAIIAINDAQYGIVPDKKECPNCPCASSSAVAPAPYKSSASAPAPYSSAAPTWTSESAPAYTETTIYETKTYTHSAPTWTTSQSEAKPTWTSSAKAPVYSSKAAPTWTSSEQAKPTAYKPSTWSKSEEKPHPTSYASQMSQMSPAPYKASSTSSEDCESTSTAAPVYSAPPSYN